LYIKEDRILKILKLFWCHNENFLIFTLLDAKEKNAHDILE